MVCPQQIIKAIHFICDSKRNAGVINNSTSCVNREDTWWLEKYDRCLISSLLYTSSMYQAGKPDEDTFLRCNWS